MAPCNGCNLNWGPRWAQHWAPSRFLAVQSGSFDLAGKMLNKAGRKDQTDVCLFFFKKTTTLNSDGEAFTQKTSRLSLCNRCWIWAKREGLRKRVREERKGNQLEGNYGKIP